MTSSPANDTSFESLKEQGNRNYGAKDFDGAIKLYSTIIEAYESENTPVDLMRTTLANRAACSLSLGKHEKVIEDCRRVLDDFPQPASSTHLPIIHKVHYRLAKSYYHLKRFDESLTQLDLFHSAHGPPEAEPSLRKFVLEAQGKGNGLPLKPFKYTVKVVGAGGNEELQHPPIIYNEFGPVDLFSPNPPSRTSGGYLLELTMKHHEDIMGMKRWFCWECSKPAESMLHNPMSFLRSNPDPEILDISLPICENRGRCDTEGRKWVQEQISQSGTYRPVPLT